ncbi:hypothetical protein [Nocardia wallacei]|uniref:hypothetical protein n=1 Tax=Nocardia wallacei TaxID=480035 RepID=UPI00245433D6|nr:hypothetical protein [Nocardia wallacei]
MPFEKLGRGGIVLAAAAAVVFSGAGSASAAPESADLGVLHSLGDTCYGQARTGISAFQPGIARFGVSWVRYTPTFGTPCNVTVFVNWRNLDTGASGSVGVPVSDGTSWNQTPSTDMAEVPTGPGRVSVTASTDRPHIPAGPVEIQVS